MNWLTYTHTHDENTLDDDDNDYDEEANKLFEYSDRVMSRNTHTHKISHLKMHSRN